MAIKTHQNLNKTIIIKIQISMALDNMETMASFLTQLILSMVKTIMINMDNILSSLQPKWASTVVLKCPANKFKKSTTILILSKVMMTQPEWVHMVDCKNHSITHRCINKFKICNIQVGILNQCLGSRWIQIHNLHLHQNKIHIINSLTKSHCWLIKKQMWEIVKSTKLTLINFYH